MQIRVITRHAPSNYGSLLQSIATIKVFQRLNYDCKIIDYIRKEERGLRQNLWYLKNNKSWNSNIFKRILFILFRLPEELIAEYRFNYLRRKNLLLTPRYKQAGEIEKEGVDIFCTGSDQVWGDVITGTYDPAYFLSFVKNKNFKKIAFSASFGRIDFSEKIISEYKNLLQSYTGISVRESQAVNLLDKMGLKCDGHVLDPTLFLSGIDWSRFITKEIHKTKYTLIYQVHNDPEFNEYAKEFSKRHNLNLIRISPYFHHIVRGGQFVYLPNVSTFLSYFKNCEYLLTDSFHGTSFALNFNKQFQVILCKDNTGSRLTSILNVTNLTRRITNNLKDFTTIYNEQIDYKLVNKILDKQREFSYDVLKQILEK